MALKHKIRPSNIHFSTVVIIYQCPGSFTFLLKFFFRPKIQGFVHSFNQLPIHLKIGEKFTHVFMLYVILFRYITANAKLSTSVVDTLLPEIPSYLHNISHWFVRHCVTCMCNTEDLVPGSVGQLTDDTFQVI